MKYTVYAKLVAIYSTEVEADNVRDAYDIANAKGPDDFKDTGDGEWVITELEDENGSRVVVGF